MIETGFASPFIDIMMLSPAERTDQISAWAFASLTLTTAFGNPISAIRSSSSSSFSRSARSSSPLNSTKRIASGSPRTKPATVGAKIAFLRERSSIVRSTNSIATGSVFTSSFVAVIASWKRGK